MIGAYKLKHSVALEGLPFFPGGSTKVVLHPGNPGDGIVYRYAGNDYPFTLNQVSATKRMSARYNSFQLAKNLSVNVIEHLHSAIVLALGFRADVIIEIAKPGYLPYIGSGVFEPYTALVASREPKSFHNYKILEPDRTDLNRPIFEDKSSRITLDHGFGNCIVNVLDASHPDVSILGKLESPIKPYRIDFQNIQEYELKARALRRTTQLHRYVFVELMNLLGGNGFGDTGYFHANPGTTPEGLIKKMAIPFQNNKNEHLAHSAISDIPSELQLLAQQYGVDDFNIRFNFSNTTHLSIVSAMQKLVHQPELFSTTSVKTFSSL